jgi:hypothetical protein
MTLRGTCVGMQKTYILPGRKVYEYPYTPELFPWFYDKALWREYLDFLVANRMNTLYLWNGHPFASLVKLKDYPEAIEVPDDVFAKTSRCSTGSRRMRQTRHLARADVLQHLPAETARREARRLHPTRRTHAARVRLHAQVHRRIREAISERRPAWSASAKRLQGTENQINWATNTILPGVLDGMKAAGLKEQPPVVIRTHAMNPEAIMPACFHRVFQPVHGNEIQRRIAHHLRAARQSQQTHRNMAKLGPHLVNVHILSNLEPFRYGATEFIRKSMHRLARQVITQAACTCIRSPIGTGLTRQTSPTHRSNNGSAIGFGSRLGRVTRGILTCPPPMKTALTGSVASPISTAATPTAASNILDAYNAAGEVAPMLIRRFGITEGNRQTLSLGMTLDQLVNPTALQRRPRFVGIHVAPRRTPRRIRAQRLAKTAARRRNARICHRRLPEIC